MRGISARVILLQITWTSCQHTPAITPAKKISKIHKNVEIHMKYMTEEAFRCPTSDKVNEDVKDIEQ